MKNRDFRVLAEAKIQDAQRRGVLDDLPGKGKPLPADAIAGLQPEQRMMARATKAAGGLPPEIQLQQEIEALRLEIEAERDAEKRRQLEGQQRDLQLRLNLLHERAGRTLTANPGLKFVPG